MTRLIPLVLTALVSLGVAGAARQDYDFRGGASYLPSGGGGFIPYRAGPGGGLGVQTRRVEPATRSPSSLTGMGAASGAGMSSLGQGRNAILPLSPIRPMRRTARWEARR